MFSGEPSRAVVTFLRHHQSVSAAPVRSDGRRRSGVTDGYIARGLMLVEVGEMNDVSEHVVRQRAVIINLWHE